MRKITIKGMLKTMVAAAAVMTMVIGFGSTAKAEDYLTDEEIRAMILEAQAEGFFDTPEYKEWDRAEEAVAAKYGISVEEVWLNPEYAKEIKIMVWGEEEYNEIHRIAEEWLAEGGVTAEVATTAQTKMLNLVNKDRKANGAGNLVWDADLEVIAKQRAVVAFYNTQTEEYANALNSNDHTKQSEIVHEGAVEGVAENAIVSFYSGVKAATANKNWIASEGHHAQRINAGWTKYACASYTDPFTGMETWVEVFADDTYSNSPDFDHMRYAAENPDVAAVFGEDKGALYHHYITCGKAEGRTGYCLDGTAIK